LRHSSPSPSRTTSTSTSTSTTTSSSTPSSQAKHGSSPQSYPSAASGRSIRRRTPGRATHVYRDTQDVCGQPSLAHSEGMPLFPRSRNHRIRRDDFPGTRFHDDTNRSLACGPHFATHSNNEGTGIAWFGHASGCPSFIHKGENFISTNVKHGMNPLGRVFLRYERARAAHGWQKLYPSHRPNVSTTIT